MSIFGNKKIIGISEAGLGLVPKNQNDSSVNETSKKEEYFEDADEIDKYDHAYRNCSHVGTAIDITAEQVSQNFYFEGPDKDALTKWADDVNFDLWLPQVVKNMLKHGKCYGELIPLKNGVLGFGKKYKLNNPLNPNKILPTGTMGIIKKVTSIYPTHFLQKVEWGSVIYWGASKPEKYPQSKKSGKLEDIYRFEWNNGLSIIHSSLLHVQIKDQMESDLPVITRRYVAPIIDISVGDENNQPNDTDIDSIKAKVDDIYADTEFVHSYLVKSSVLGFQGRMVDTSPLFEHVDYNIEVGTQTPIDMFFGKGSNEKGSETKLRNYGRHVKHIQRILKAEIEDKILSRMTGNKDNDIVWGYNEEREKEMEIDIVRGLKTDGIITPQKANDLLPDRYKEVLPDNLKDPQKAMMNGMNGNPQNKGADGMKDRHNKTDPTKSTQIEDGKRLNKKDRGVTLKRSA